MKKSSEVYIYIRLFLDENIHAWKSIVKKTHMFKNVKQDDVTSNHFKLTLRIIE